MKRIYTKGLILLLALLLCLSPTSYGWNKPTHMIIGAIAYRELKAASPKTVARIIAILKQHPYYQKEWKEEMSKYKLVEDEDMYLFMIASKWPDDVRSGEGDYHHPTWHYVNYPYKPSDKIATDSYPATGENIVSAYKDNLAVLKSNAEDSKKAIALCWIFHLVGDLHQPLHTSAYITDMFPQGDKGGNLFKIKVKEDSKTINLHSFWDGLILGSGNYGDINNTAVELRQRIAKNTLPAVQQKDFVEWSKESFLLAKTQAYRNGELTASIDDNKGALLPVDYPKTAKVIAETQVALSAYRLAYLLNAGSIK